MEAIQTQLENSTLTSVFSEWRGDTIRIASMVRFDGWQATVAGERQVKQALRASLLKYKLHTDQELFDKAYGYIKQYY